MSTEDGREPICTIFTEKFLIPEEFESFAKEVYDSYGDLSGDELEQLNHTEMPWIKARAGLKPWQGCNNVIAEEDMKAFYRTLMENEE